MKRKMQKRVSPNNVFLGYFHLKNLLSFLKKNFILTVFVICIGFVGLIAFYKIFISKPTYVYVKVKVGQGLWWASTQRPSLWFIKALQKTTEQKDLTGKTTAKIINVQYYPYYGGSQYDVYITAMLKVSMIKGTGTYNFNRESIGVSSPIDLEFPNIQFSGTIIEMSEKPINDTYIEKIVYFTKKYAYPSEYDEVQVGDVVTNGRQIIFQILEKGKGATSDVLLNDMGKISSVDVETYRYIVIKARMKVKMLDDQLVYGEEYTVAPGRTLGFVTDRSILNEYYVAKIE